MNKKLLIGIIAGIAALAVLIVGIFVVVKSIDGSRPEDGSSMSDSANKNDSSDSSSTTDKNNNPENNLNEEAISSGTNSTVESNDSSLESELIKVPVKITENPGIFMGVIDIKYDADALTCVGYENKGGIMELFIEPQYEKGKITAIMENSEMKDVNKTGTLITLIFKAKKTAAAGSYPIEFGENLQFSNYNEQLVNPKLEIPDVKIEK